MSVKMNVVTKIIVKAQGSRRSLVEVELESDENLKERYISSSYMQNRSRIFFAPPQSWQR